MKRYIFLFILAIILLVASSVDAATYRHNNRTFKSTTDKKIETDKLIYESVREDNTETVNSIIRDVKCMRNVKIEVVMCEYTFTKAKAFTYFNKKEQKHYIYIALNTRDFNVIASVVLHELGHIFDTENNINLKYHNKLMYSIYKINTGTNHDKRSDENFADTFAAYHMRILYPYSVFTLNYIYSWDLDRFEKIYRRNLR